MSTKTKKTIVAIPKTHVVQVTKINQVNTTNTHVNIQTTPIMTIPNPAMTRKIPINNIVRLNLFTIDIQRLEQKLKHERMGLLSDINTIVDEPMAFNNNNHERTICNVIQDHNVSNPFKGLIKRSQIDVKDPSKAIKQTISLEEKRDLIINSGIKRRCHKIMDIYSGQSWPTSSSYACWYDCHIFKTTPVGIPQLLIGDTFFCRGNFCSYNCALRYLCPDDEDDLSQIHTNADHFSGDDLSDQLQLLELLCRMETSLSFDEPLRKASKRLCLKLFGGNMTIEEFRATLSMHNMYHIFRSPMVPISYQMEESIGRPDTQKKQKGVSLNMNKLEKAYTEFLDKHCKDETLLQKLYRNKRAPDSTT